MIRGSSSRRRRRSADASMGTVVSARAGNEDRQCRHFHRRQAQHRPRQDRQRWQRSCAWPYWLATAASFMRRVAGSVQRGFADAIPGLISIHGVLAGTRMSASQSLFGVRVCTGIELLRLETAAVTIARNGTPGVPDLSSARDCSTRARSKQYTARAPQWGKMASLTDDARADDRCLVCCSGLPRAPNPLTAPPAPAFPDR